MRDKPLNIKEAIHEMLDSYRIKKKYKNTEVIAAWNELMPKIILNEIEYARVSDGVFYIKSNSSIVKNELMYSKSKIIIQLNKEIGMNLIKEIKIL